MSKTNFNPHLELPPEQGSSQQQFPSVYPKIPISPEEPPSYDTTVHYNMPQPSHSQPQQEWAPQQYYRVQQNQVQQQTPQFHQPINNTRPQQGMAYGSIPPPNLNVVQQQTVQPITSLRTKSDLVQCPHCQQYVYTVIDYESGLCTGLSVGGLFLAGCHSGGCLLPFLFPWTKDISHICPSCQQKIATFTRLERDTRVTAPPSV